jgi:hypothetical protein
MTHQEGASPRRVRSVLSWLYAAAFIAAIAATGLLAGLWNGAGLLFLLAGSAAAALMSFRPREIVAACRHAAGGAGSIEDLRRSAHVWEASARNAWILGVLGSAMNFTFVLGGGSGSIASASVRMIESFLVTLYGLVLAAVCFIPLMKIAGRTGNAAAGAAARTEPRRSFARNRAAGSILLAALRGLTVVSLLGGKPQEGPLPVVKVMLHGPAFLIVFGGAAVLALFMGAGAGGRAWSLGFAMTGLIGLLLGFIQALFGFAHTSVQEIAAAIAFVISASLYTLLGLLAVAAPTEDREIMEGRRERSAGLSRAAWWVFPLIAFLFLLLSFLMVVTPMKRPG